MRIGGCKMAPVMPHLFPVLGENWPKKYVVTQPMAVWTILDPSLMPQFLGFTQKHAIFPNLFFFNQQLDLK